MISSFTTDRLILDPLDMEDAGFILELLNSDGFITFIGDRKVRTIEDARNYIEKIMANADISYWIVKLKDGIIPVGIVTRIKRSYLDHPDIGFAFLPGFNNKGYAFEAAHIVLMSLLNDYGHKSILATAALDNTRSMRLLGKLGLKPEMKIKVEGEDLMLYRISIAG